MDEDELSAMTVAELKKRLKELSLTTSGKKADLITRLLESEDDEDVLILDDEDDEEITISHEFEDDEILEAEVFEAEIIDEIIIESESPIRTTRNLNPIEKSPQISGVQWYKDGTAIATILVVVFRYGFGKRKLSATTTFFLPR